MIKKLYLPLVALMVLALSSCGKMGELSSDYFTTNPEVLEAVAGKVPVTINGKFPEKYMKKNATVEVTPVIRWNGGEAKGQPAMFQGEKVEGNGQTISYKVGGNYTMKANFDYVPEMANSELYLDFKITKGSKTYTIPSVKIADGVIATSELPTAASSNASYAEDAYQRIIKQAQEANIMFLIQQANLRNSQLKSDEMKEFHKKVAEVNADTKNFKLNNIEVSAYASPDGGVKLNTGLAENREKNAEKYLNRQLKKAKIEANVDAKYTAQDWEGFQELVRASNIQDKEVILRVLSMYKEPEEREQQIKNMSAGFEELANGILPELRRARLTINYEIIGRDDEQIMAQYKADPKVLSVDELLYAAVLTENKKEQEAIYATTTKVYPNDARAYNNIATIAYSEGNYSKAKEYAEKALKINANCNEATANLGLIALKDGKVSEAEALIAKASGANGIEEVIGNLNLAKGNYAQAEYDMRKAKSNSAALAQILNNNYSAALQTLNSVAAPDGTTEYLKAIVYARQGNNNASAAALKNAIAKDSSWAKYAANDLELSNVSK